MARILVIDDEEDMRAAIRNVLVDEGHEVWEAGDSEYGLARIRESPPDLVLLDIRLAGLDSGIRVLGRIRETHKALPIIAVTGYGSEESFEEILSHGARCCLRKPFDNAKLAELVRLCLAAP